MEDVGGLALGRFGSFGGGNVRGLAFWGSGDSAEDVFAEAEHDAFFQTGDVRLGDAEEVGYFFLCQLFVAVHAEAEGDDVLFAFRQTV